MGVLRKLRGGLICEELENAFRRLLGQIAPLAFFRFFERYFQGQRKSGLLDGPSGAPCRGGFAASFAKTGLEEKAPAGFQLGTRVVDGGFQVLSWAPKKLLGTKL